MDGDRTTIRVVKCGGRVQQAAELVSLLARAWRDAPRTLCIVHGGGDEISMLQRALGIEPAFVGGRRVTTERDIDFVRMCLSGSANKRLVSALLDAGAPAWGVSGEDGGLIVGRTDSSLPLGRVGVPARVDASLLRIMLSAGKLPVVSPVARDEAGGGALNVNGDDAAAAIAGALHADELLLIVDVDGVLGDDGYPIAQLDRRRAGSLVSAGVASRGMAAKLEAGFAALSAGVARVRIGPPAMVADASVGTALTTSAEVLI